MEIHAVYSRLYNVAMFTESKIQVKKVPRVAFFSPPRISSMETVPDALVSTLEENLFHSLCTLCICHHAGETSRAEN